MDASPSLTRLTTETSSSSSSSAGPLGRQPFTISQAFACTVSKYGRKIAIRDTVPKENVPEGAQKFSEKFDMVAHTWTDYNSSARAFAKSLIAHNVAPHAAVTIQGTNAPQWLFANVGTILAGGITAGSYPTNNPELSQHVAKSSGSEVVVVESEAQLKKYQGMKDSAVKCFVVWNKVQDAGAGAGLSAPVISWNEFLKRGEAVPDAELDERIEAQKPGDVCSLIYTSGTTGMPKAAALTHDNLTWTAAAVGEVFKLNASHQSLSYLPLSHIAAQQLDCIVPLIYGSAVNIAPSDALKGTNLKQHILNARPTYFLAVPRVWEKFKEGIEQAISQASSIKQFVFKAFCWLGRNIQELQAKAQLTALERVQLSIYSTALNIMSKCFGSPKALLGLDRCQIAASGAGALSPEVVDFFKGLNIRIIDLFGMSETSGPTTISYDRATPAGSCGKPLPGTEIEILNPNENGEGEICMKGRHVMSEYFLNPDATHEAIDERGFLHSGDLGKVDGHGNVFITGRLKELIKTSGGENIPPVRIEQKIKKQLPIVSQAVVIGDKRQFLTCLLTLQTEVDADGAPTDRLAKNVLDQLQLLGSEAKTVQEAANDLKLHVFLIEGIQRANKQADSAAQQVQKIAVLPEDFSVANGTMTATLKLKRPVIAQRHAPVIEALYA